MQTSALGWRGAGPPFQRRPSTPPVRTTYHSHSVQPYTFLIHLHPTLELHPAIFTIINQVKQSCLFVNNTLDGVARHKIATGSFTT